MNIKKLNFKSDLSLYRQLSSEIIDKVGWGITNQIGLRSLSNSSDPWFDSVGSLFDRTTNTFKNTESNFNVWNLDPTNYIRQQIEKLQDIENINVGRIRIMKLLPKHGLSVHRDNEFRYHFVLKTNNKAYFSFNNNNNISTSDVTEVGTFYHIPADSHWYFVDTTKVHWVYNGGDDERIHIVVCGIPK